MSLQRQHFLLSYFKDPKCWSFIQLVVLAKTLCSSKGGKETGNWPEKYTLKKLIRVKIPTTRSPLCNGNIYISQACLLLQVTFAQVLHTIGSTHLVSCVWTSGANTLYSIAHYSTADVVWSTAALCLARICKQ